MRNSLDTCARELLDVMPLVMQDLRRTMQGHLAPDLRVPELRSLAFLRQHPGSNLTDLAECIGVSLPSMSKLVDALAFRKLVDRQPDPSDRRRVRLFLTEEGGALLARARKTVKAAFAAKLARLEPGDVDSVAACLEMLRGLFTGSDTDDAADKPTGA